MKIKFTCPKCGGHILDHKVIHTESTTEEIIGMDEDEDAIHSDVAGDYWEGRHENEFSCGQCQHEVASAVEVKEMIEQGLKEGWIEKVEE